MVCRIHWTENVIDLLRKMWEEGHSASEIACVIPNATRSAIIGKKHRLGLPSHGKTPPHSSQNDPQRKHRARLNGRQVIMIDFTEAIEEVTEPVPYLDLQEHHCRALMEDRGGEWNLRLCCGRPRLKIHGVYLSSYCSMHDQLFMPGRYTARAA